MECRNDNKKENYFSKSKIRLKNSQFYSTFGVKMVPVSNKNIISNGSHTNSIDKKLTNTQFLNHNEGNFLATKLSRQTSFDDPKFSVAEGSFIVTVPVSRKKDMVKVSKSKTNTLVSHNYSKKYKTRNNLATDFYQVRPINKDGIKTLFEKNDASKRKKLYSTSSSENHNVVCYESDYKLISNTSGQITTIISSLNFTENNAFEENDNFHKLFKVRSRQKPKLHNQSNVEAKNNTGGNQKAFLKTILVQPIDSEYERNRHLSSYKSSTENKQKENRILVEKFLEEYVKDTHTKIDKVNEKKDKSKTINTPSTKTTNKDENCNINNTFIEKVKQHIIKLADKITPKVVDIVPNDVNYMKTLVIDEIKLQEIVTLFNNNPTKPYKENDTAKLRNVPYSKERKNNKLDARVSINVRSSPERFTDEYIQNNNNLVPTNINNTPVERKNVNICELKQSKAYQGYDNFLVRHFDSKENFLNNDKIAKSNTSVKTISNFRNLGETENSFDNHTAINDNNVKNINHVNSVIVKVNLNGEVKKPLKFPIDKACLDSENAYWSKVKMMPELRSSKQNTNNLSPAANSSAQDIPHNASITSISKPNAEKVRPNSKFTIKNTLIQNDEMYHPNKRIKRHIEEISNENVLQTSTSHSSRKSWLNDKPLPYQVSLMSLPVNATNINSNASLKRKCSNYKESDLSKLNYYSNLDSNYKRAHKNTYEVRYFEFKNNLQTGEKSEPPATKNVEQQTDSKADNVKSNMTSAFSEYTTPWGQSFEVRVFEYDTKTPNADLPMAMNKSKYYSYPDPEDYIENARRRSMERTEYVNRKPISRTYPQVSPPGTSQYRGENRMASEPWAPFAISDTSLPPEKKNKNKNEPPAQTQLPATCNVSRDKKAGISGAKPVKQTPGGGAGSSQYPDNYYQGYRPNYYVTTSSEHTDTDDLFSAPQYVPKRMTDAATTHYSTTKSKCQQCDLPRAQTAKEYQRETPKQNVNNYEYSPSPHTCGILKDICLCDYTGKYHGPCGSKTSKKTEVTSKPNTLSCATYNKSPEINEKKKDCSNCYNNNPHVMYCFGEQQKTSRKTKQYIKREQTSSEGYYDSGDASRLSYSLGSTDTETSLYNSNIEPIAENYCQPDTLKHKENIIQYCLDQQSNSIQDPRLQKSSHNTDKLNDEKQQLDLKKIQADKYYVLCLPNEVPVGKENCNLTCFPHDQIINPNNKSSEQLHKLDENDIQLGNASIMLKSFLQSKNNKENKFQKNKLLSTSNLDADELWTEKLYDSTLYVFQEPPISQQILSTNMIDAKVSSESDIPTNEKPSINSNQITINLAKESTARSLKENRGKPQKNTYHTQIHSKKNDELAYYLFEQNENVDTLNRKKSDIVKHSYRKLKYFKDGYKHSILLIDDSHNSSKTRLSTNHMAVESPFPINETSNHASNRYCSIGINTDSAQNGVSGEIFTKQSCFEVCNPADYNKPIRSNRVIEFPKTPVIKVKKRVSKKGTTQEPEMLLNEFAIQESSNQVTDTKHANNKMNTTIGAIQYGSQESSIGNERLLKNLIYGGLSQDIKSSSLHTTPVSNFFIHDNSKEINSNTSKHRILISQLADTSSFTQTISVPSSPLYLKNATNQVNQFIYKKKIHSGTHSIETNTDKDHCDDKRLPIYFSTGTQSPPVVYRSKISNCIETCIQQFPTKSINTKSEFQIDGKNEQETCSKSATQCVTASIQTDEYIVSNCKLSESMIECNPANKFPSNAMQNIVINNNDKKNEGFVQYADKSHEIQSVIDHEVTSTSRPPIAIDDTTIRSASQAAHHETCTPNEKDNLVNNILNVIMPKTSSDDPIASVKSSNSDIYTDVYRSRLFACNSLLSVPIQFQNKKSNFGTNSFWIPPDYDDSELNVYASDSKLSHYSNFKDNITHNISRQSSQISSTNEIKSMCNIDKGDVHPDKPLDSDNHSTDAKTRSYIIPRTDYKKASSTRIVPVSLAMSQEDCQKVTSGPIIPVVLANSQEYQQDPSSPCTMRSSGRYKDIYFSGNMAKGPAQVNVIKRFSDEPTSKVNKALHPVNSSGKRTVNPVKEDNTEDTVYWALTRVKIHRDGSQVFEVLDATIPAAHVLVPTANNVVLVENQSYISSKRKEIVRK